MSGVTVDLRREAGNHSQPRVVPTKMDIEAFHVVG